MAINISIKYVQAQMDLQRRNSMKADQCGNGYLYIWKTLSALCQKPDFLLFIQNMSLFCLIFRCCQKKPEMRFQNMETVQKKLSRIQKRQSQSKIKNILALSGTVLHLP